jgi:hypothetical protein
VDSILYVKLLVGIVFSAVSLCSVLAESPAVGRPVAANLSMGANQKSGVVVGGAMAPTLKSKKLSEVPKKIFQAINPFAPVKTEAKQSVPGVSSRSWPEITGWNPGQSQFASEVSHEPRAVLVRVSKSSGR